MPAKVTKERKINVYLTDDQKLGILKDYDQMQRKVNKVCEKWGIANSTLYAIKRQYWGIYETTKETMNNRDKIATLNTMAIDTSRKSAMIEKKAVLVLDKVLDLMEYKLGIEEQRVRGEIITDEKVSVNDLTNFFKTAAPYFLKIQEGNVNDPAILQRKHSFITNILNQQIINNHDRKSNNQQGISPGDTKEQANQ